MPDLTGTLRRAKRSRRSNLNHLSCCVLAAVVAVAVAQKAAKTAEKRVAPTGAAVPASAKSTVTTTTGSDANVIVNEVIANNEAPLPQELVSSLQAQAGYNSLPKTPDWVELKNIGFQDVNLQGWQLKTHNTIITLPDTSIPANGLLLVVAEGKTDSKPEYNAAVNASATSATSTTAATPKEAGKKSSVAAATPTVKKQDGPLAADNTVEAGPEDAVPAVAAPGGAAVRAAFKLDADGTKLSKLTVLRPDGSVSDRLGWTPDQRANVSWGYGPGVKQRTFLATPTPGADNSGAAQEGPFITNLTDQVQPAAQPGQGIQVDVHVGPNINPVKDVILTYVIGFGKEQQVTASKSKDGSAGAEGNAEIYVATIPGNGLKAGDLVRWAATATDSTGLSSRYPPAATGSPQPGEPAASSQYYGTVVQGIQDPDIKPDGNATIPVFEWFTQAPDQSGTTTGAGGSVIYFEGRVYDGVYVRRRGVSSLAWKKPKYKMIIPENRKFMYDDKEPGVDEFGLQSHFYELGQRSYLKDTLGLKLLDAAGVPTPQTRYIHVRLNGKFYGLFSIIENVDNTFLKRNKMTPGGPLFKSEHGELSNLRWDIKPQDMHSYYSMKYPRDKKNNTKLGHKSSNYPGSIEWTNLGSLTKGLAGGAAVKRSAFLLENLDIPQVINVLAAQVIINNQDRCTKNFFMYQDPVTSRWSMLPWDLDGALGQDNSLGGNPGDKYCVLACEQWNSPLYCDSEHTQDLQRVTPWGIVTVKMDDPFTGVAAAAPRRALLQSSKSPSPAPVAYFTTFAPKAAAPAPVAAQTPAPAPVAPKNAAPVAVSQPSAPTAPTTAAQAPAVAKKAAPPAAGATAPKAAAAGGGGWSMANGVRTMAPTAVERLVIVPKSFPQPKGWDNPDEDLSGTQSPIAAAGTYNHLVDAISDAPATRAMLMRRIRTLTDDFLAEQGKLMQAYHKHVNGSVWHSLQMANQTYAQVRGLAIRDAQQWQSNIDIDKGYQQIISEYIPVREYLLTTFYGPNGTRPLIPSSQAPGALGMLRMKEGTAKSVSWIEVFNPDNDVAIDISNWELNGPNYTFKFKPGTVVPGAMTLYVVSDVAAFDKAMAGKGYFSTGPLKPRKAGDKYNNKDGVAGQAPGNTVQLTDDKGTVIAQS